MNAKDLITLGESYRDMLRAHPSMQDFGLESADVRSAVLSTLGNPCELVFADGRSMRRHSVHMKTKVCGAWVLKDDADEIKSIFINE